MNTDGTNRNKGVKSKIKGQKSKTQIKDKR
jgi:hypothetical protein